MPETTFEEQISLELAAFVGSGESIGPSVERHLRGMELEERAELVGGFITTLALDELDDGPRNRIEWLRQIEAGELRLLYKMSTIINKEPIYPGRRGLLRGNGAGSYHSSPSRSRWLAGDY